MRYLAALAIAATLATTSCGGDESKTEPRPVPSSAAPASTPAPLSADRLIAEVGCEGGQDATHLVSGAISARECRALGLMTVAVFSGPDAMRRWVDRQPPGRAYLLGMDWVIRCLDPGDCQTAEALIGGELRTP